MSNPEDDEGWILGDAAAFSDWLTYIILLLVKEECSFPDNLLHASCAGHELAFRELADSALVRIMDKPSTGTVAELTPFAARFEIWIKEKEAAGKIYPD
jgi:hypothetical protein